MTGRRLLGLIYKTIAFLDYTLILITPLNVSETFDTRDCFLFNQLLADSCVWCGGERVVFAVSVPADADNTTETPAMIRRTSALPSNVTSGQILTAWLF